MPTTPPENPQSTRVPVPIGERGLQLRSMEDLYRFGQAVVKSGLAPRGMESPEKVLIAIQTGMEAGLTPMRALSSVVVIGGAPSWKGDAARALVEHSGELKPGTHVQAGVRGEGEQMIGWCRSWRRDAAELEETTFSVADAKRAALWGKQGPWTQYPKRMLQYRALGFHLRDHFSHVLLGLRIAEEQQDIELHPLAGLPALAGDGAPQVPAWAMDAPAQAQPEPLPSADEPSAPPPEAAEPEPETDSPDAGVDYGEAPIEEEDGPFDEDDQAQLSAIVRERARDVFGASVTREQERRLGMKVLAKFMAKESKQLRKSKRADIFAFAETVK